MYRHRSTVVALGIAALCLTSCARHGADRRDVLLVTIDTARADHFSFMGHAPISTPAIDELAADGVIFELAIAPTPITLPSHASLLTGQLPPRHGVRSNGAYRLSPESTTMAEILAGDGFATGAFVAASVLDRRHGLNQGFYRYDDRMPSGKPGLFHYSRRSADVVVEEALAWLGRQPKAQSTLLWVHLYDPHAPYDPPEPERALYPESAYGACIAFADRQIGVLLEGYRKLGRYDDTVAVITSDHGESLGEHRESTHGVFLYDATMRVPLVIRAPGSARGVRVSDQVSLVDVLPTVLSLIGLTTPVEVDGRDLTPLLRRETQIPEPGPLYLESRLPLVQYGWAPLSGIRTPGWKMISGAAPELYDLEADPLELRNLAEERPEVLDRFSKLADSFVAIEKPPSTVAIDDVTRAELAALGYVSVPTAHAVSGQSPGTLPDPREHIEVVERAQAAIQSFAAGHHGEAILALRHIASRNPQNLFVTSALADLLAWSGRYEEALEAFARANELAPGRATILTSRGQCLERLGRFDEALAAYRESRAADPSFKKARSLRWDLLERHGRRDEFIQEARDAVEEDARDAEAHLAIALHHGETSGRAAAIDSLEQALAITEGSPVIAVALAKELIREGETVDGRRLLREVLAREPKNPRAAAALSKLLLDEGNIADSRQVLEVAAQTPVADAEVLLLLAEAMARDADVVPALPIARRAATLRPDLPATWSTLGSVLVMAGNPAQAVKAYERSLALFPGDRTTLLNMAMAYDRMGLTKRAQELSVQAQRLERPDIP